MRGHADGDGAPGCEPEPGSFLSLHLSRLVFCKSELRPEGNGRAVKDNRVPEPEYVGLSPDSTND